MTAHRYNRDDEPVSPQPVDGSSEPAAGSGTLETSAGSGSVTRETQARKRNSRARQAGSSAETAPRRKPRSGAGGTATRGRSKADRIIELPKRHPGTASLPEQAAATAAALSELEAQGFTEDEAYQLIHVSDRIANSRETREAEAVIRRLRFNRWLFEQGKLSEFSA